MGNKVPWVLPTHLMPGFARDTAKLLLWFNIEWECCRDRRHVIAASGHRSCVSILLVTVFSWVLCVIGFTPFLLDTCQCHVLAFSVVCLAEGVKHLLG